MAVIVDGHLDVAMNALLHERDQTLPVAALHQREAGGAPDERGTAMVSLPELKQAGVVLFVGTVIARAKAWIDPTRAIGRSDLDYPDPAMAHAAAQGQLAYYEYLARAGHINLITSAEMLDAHMRRALAPGAVANDASLGCLLMMEGADPIVEPAEVHRWHAQGLRCLSLAHFGHSRYAAGTPSRDPNSAEKDGPLSALGVELLEHMNELTMALDLTHLSDTSFFQAIDRFDGPVCATHANCRSLAPSPRQLTDRQLKLIIERDGVIGVVGHAGMIKAHADGPSIKPGDVGLRHLADHVDHICQLAGSARHVAIGSDLDGGFGRETTPADLQQYRDLHALGPLLAQRGFSESDQHAFFYENWWRFYRRVLQEEKTTEDTENTESTQK
jgi:membrane dipeptidase